MDIQNILSFGAKKRVERRLEQYEKTFKKAEKAEAKFEKARGKALLKFNDFMVSQKKSMATIRSMRSNIFKLDGTDRLAIKILKNSLKSGKKDLMSLSLTDQQIYAHAISRFSYSEALGISIAGAAVGMGAAVAVSASTTISAAAASGSAISASALTSSVSITSAGIGNLSWMSVGAIALPVSILAMAGMNHWSANSKISKINEAEEILVKRISQFEFGKIKAIELKEKSEEKKSILDGCINIVSADFDYFYNKCQNLLSKFSRWQRFKAHIYLFLNINTDLLLPLYEDQKKIRMRSSEIYDLMTKSVIAA